MGGSWRDDAAKLVLASAAVAGTTAAYRLLHVTSPTTAALTYLLIVLAVATVSRLRVAIATLGLADVCLNYFFMPPFGRLSIADPQNWVALLVFFAVSVVASRLSASVRDRERQATARRHDLGRLFALSRDVLLTTDGGDAIRQLPQFVRDRFEFQYAAVCVPHADQWDVYEAGTAQAALDRDELSRLFAAIARDRDDPGRAAAGLAGPGVRLVPLWFGARTVGLLATAGGLVEPGLLDPLAGIVAIAIERAQSLDARKAAELARRSEELKSTLLASLAHDLKTPLTAIYVSAGNLEAPWLTDADRRDQCDVILSEVARLNRLFENLLDMARIDAGAVSAEPRWVHPVEVFEAARLQVEHTVGRHRIELDCPSDRVVRLDPRLTAAALAHVLENAAQYTPADSPVEVALSVGPEELTIEVRDHGSGIARAEMPFLFDRFYRGAEARRRPSGTGMGLAIARGLLAAEGGRISVENCADGGARFTLAVPAPFKSAVRADHLE